MKISLSNNKAFQTAITAINKAMESRATRPILTSFVISADETNSIATFYATDLEVGIRAEIKTTEKIELGGSVILPGKLFLKMIKQFPKNAEFTVKNEIKTSTAIDVVISCGKKSFTFSATPPLDDYPSIPVAPIGSNRQEHLIKTETLQELIKKTSYAITTEETRYALNGAQFVITRELVRMVTTDAHRLALAEHSQTNTFELETLIPKKAIALLKQYLDGDFVEITATDNHLFFEFDNFTIDTRTLEGQFPGFDKVIPKDNDKRIIFTCSDMIEAIKSTSLMSHETSRAIKLVIEADSLTVEASNPEVGKAESTIDVVYDGPNVSIGFNAKYLLDYLATIDKEAMVALLLKNDSIAGLMQEWSGYNGTNDDYCYVIMPMRI